MRPFGRRLQESRKETEVLLTKNLATRAFFSSCHNSSAPNLEATGVGERVLYGGTDNTAFQAYRKVAYACFI
jgi:hypothetical protein